MLLQKETLGVFASKFSLEVFFYHSFLPVRFHQLNTVLPSINLVAVDTQKLRR